VTSAALIVAAGQGTRAPGPRPKQYARIGGVPVLARTLTLFLAHPLVDHVQVVIGADDQGHYEGVMAALAAAGKLLPPVEGGTTRQRSVLAGLQALAALAPDAVLIHDAVRPFLDPALIIEVLQALDHVPGAIAALPVADTLKTARAGGLIAGTLERTGLWRAQTPQAFRFADILRAHEAAAAAGRADFTDDAAVAEWAGLPVRLVLGREANTKLTTPEHLAMADRALSPLPAPDIRTGSGFDVHRLVAGDHVWLCGVKVAHTQCLEGHSDADVGLHALTDALLGAIGDGDIGEHFRNTDPRWRDAPSHLFLADALARVRAKGGRIGNVDVTLLCEAPKTARPCASVLRPSWSWMCPVSPSKPPRPRAWASPAGGRGLPHLPAQPSSSASRIIAIVRRIGASRSKDLDLGPGDDR
jgi:2-C-methyl-D-erythritol 4-phosphate cytidylyltransferase / 2-C-methyl-D-erythritol 2,4-cyclodiphosphate synthase